MKIFLVVDEKMIEVGEFYHLETAIAAAQSHANQSKRQVTITDCNGVVEIVEPESACR